MDDGIPEMLGNLAQVEVESGRVDDGVAHAYGCLVRTWEKGIAPVAGFAVIVIAQGHLAAGEIERGLRMIGTVMADPRTDGIEGNEVGRVLSVTASTRRWRHRCSPTAPSTRWTTSSPSS